MGSFNSGVGREGKALHPLCSKKIIRLQIADVEKCLLFILGALMRSAKK